MKAYRILVHDMRFGSPVELAAELAHDARAKEVARERFDASDDIKAVEAWAGAVRLCRLERQPDQAAA